MANKKQVSLLKQAIDSWNQWRKENPEVKIELNGANLSNALLIGADLHEADLSSANLNMAILRFADLNRANLTNAELKYADLENAKLECANLNRANLYSPILSGALFTQAYLRGTNLVLSRATNTSFSGADLTGACILDWHINSSTNLEGVQCGYIYRGQDSETLEYTDRLPVNPDQFFKSGEFENWIKISAEAQRTIDLTFPEGIDWQAFFQSLQEVCQEYPDADVSLQAIEKKGSVFLIRLETASDADQSAIETLTTELYDTKFKLREAQGEIKVLREMSDVLKQLAGKAMSQPTNQTTIHAQSIGIHHSGSGDIKDFTQNIGSNLDEIGSLIQSLRRAAQSFPSEHKEVVEGELEDLEHDIKTPENHQPKRIGRRLKGLLAAGTAVAGIAGSTITGAADLSKQADDFTSNVLELANKLGIELVQE